MSFYIGSNHIDNDKLIKIINMNTEELNFISHNITQYSNNDIIRIKTFAFHEQKSLTSINLPNCSYIGSHAFENCFSLASINLPNCSYISYGAFNNCSALTSINLPNCSYIGGNAFVHCTALTSINLPNCSYISDGAFTECYSLTSISLPNCSYIGNYAFMRCYNLLSVYLLGSSIPSLPSTSAFLSTPISTYTTSTGGRYGSIYVPTSLYNNYLTATNWSVYSARIVSV